MGAVHDDIHDVNHEYEPLNLTPLSQPLLLLLLSDINEDGVQCAGKGFY